MLVEETVTVLRATVNEKQISWCYQQSMPLQCQSNLVPHDYNCHFAIVINQSQIEHIKADGGIHVHDMQLNPHCSDHTQTTLVVQVPLPLYQSMIQLRHTDVVL